MMRGRLHRIVLVGAGTVCVALGAVGTMVPVLPTTPFLLLAAACYARSSGRMHRWLITNRIFGRYLGRYERGEGIPLTSMVLTLIFLWAGLGSSAFLAVPPRLWWVRLLLMAVGGAISVHIVRIGRRSGRKPRRRHPSP